MSPKEDGIIRELLIWVDRQLRAGTPEHRIEAHLVERGLDDSTAALMVAECKRALKDMQLEAARAADTPNKNMIRGGLWLGGGLLVTFVTWNQPVGIIAYGAIAYGGAQLFMGFVRRGDKPAP